MTEMLDRIAKAMRTYSVSRIREADRDGHVTFAGFAIYHRDNQENPVERIGNADKADTECDRLNARAVLDAMREPTKEMIKAGIPVGCSSPDHYSDQAECLKISWRAMIDVLLKSE